MKKLTLIAAMALSLSSSAQISLEKSYSSYGQVSVHNLENIGYRYMALDFTGKKIYLFDESHNLWKTISPSFPLNSMFISANYASTTLFDTDAGVEVSVNYIDTTGGASNWKYYTSIVEESGYLAFTINDCNYGYVTKVGNNWKMIATKVTQPTYSEVYSLPGKLLSVQKPGKGSANGELDALAFPNPAEQSVDISYSLPVGTNSGVIQLYNSAGALINTYPVNKSSGVLTVNRASLPSGIYYYTLKASGAKSETHKIVFK